MIKTNIKRLLLIKKFKKDIIGNLLLKRKLLLIKLLLIKFINKKKKAKQYFYRIGVIEKPFYSKRKTKYGKYFLKRQQFRLFYSFIRIKSFKAIIKKTLKCKNSLNMFLYLMESRLDLFIFRLGLVTSLRMARQLILHGYIYINNKLIKAPSKNLKENDILTFDARLVIYFKKLIYKNIKKKKLLVNKIPNYIEYNLQNLLFMFTQINIYDLKFFFRINIHVFHFLVNFYRRNIF